MSIAKSCAVSVGLAVLALSTGAFAQEVKDGPGKDLFVQHCTLCHQADTVTTQRHSAAEWRGIVERMVQNGAQVTDPERETIIGYLSSLYGSAAGGAAPNNNATKSSR